MSYTITDTQYTQLKSDAQATVDAVNALVPDAVDPAVLQQQLDAANAQVAALTAHLATLGADVDAIVAAAQKAQADK